MGMGEKAADELVLAVPADEVDELFRIYALGPPWLPAAPLLEGDGLGGWLAEHAEFRRRRNVEGDESVRHVATYSILTSGGRILTYRRGRSGSEARLHGLLSIGVGGHAMLEDFLGWEDLGPEVWVEGLDVAAEREVREEVKSAWAISADRRFAGLIAGDETACDRVHLGYVALWETLPSDNPIVPREGCLEDPRWMTVEELRGRSAELEPWSAIVLDRLLAPAPEVTPS